MGNLFKGIVKLSKAHYDELKANGTLTVGENTITYDQDILYVTPSSDTNDTVLELTHTKIDDDVSSIMFIDDQSSAEGTNCYTNDKLPVIRITNTGTIILNGSTEKEWVFELVTSNYKNSNITMTYMGCEGPMNFEFETYTTYIGKIIDGKVCYIGKFDSYPDKWIYGSWYSSDFSKSFTFDNLFNFTATTASGDISGTYSIEDGMISLNIDGGTVDIQPITKVSNTQMSIGTYGTFNK